jgi:hypothetical protein
MVLNFLYLREDIILLDRPTRNYTHAGGVKLDMNIPQ